MDKWMIEKDINILLVEDDEIDVRAVQRAFKKEKIANPMTVAGDGVEALEILRGENGRAPLARPYLILLDLKMPRMNGLAFLEALRQDAALRRSIVFVLTTSNDDRDIVAAYDQNISGYLLKDDVGLDFLQSVQMLEQFVLSVRFPPTV